MTATTPRTEELHREDSGRGASQASFEEATPHPLHSTHSTHLQDCQASLVGKGIDQDRGRDSFTKPSPPTRSFSAAFLINFCIPNFIPFLVLSLFLLGTEGYQSRRGSLWGLPRTHPPHPHSHLHLPLLPLPLVCRKALVSQASPESQRAGPRVND